MSTTGLLHSLPIVADMARLTAPSIIDERARSFARRVVHTLQVNLVVTGGPRVSPRETYVYMSSQES
jgi:hypothetical protein